MVEADLFHFQATGNLGPAILDALLAANFSVTVLTRASSTHAFPPSVTVARVDYESLGKHTSQDPSIIARLPIS